jgi:hypothetical protein
VVAQAAEVQAALQAMVDRAEVAETDNPQDQLPNQANQILEQVLTQDLLAKQQPVVEVQVVVELEKQEAPEDHQLAEMV